MTWVIASGGALTRGIMMADTQVTAIDSHGRTREFDIGVQKVHAVANNIALGFAGDVEVGFGMVADLTRTVLRSVPAGYMTNQPSKLLLGWARTIRHRWSRLPEEMRRQGCELLYVAALPPHSEFGFTPPVVWMLRAQDGFQPRKAGWSEVLSIGSGTNVAEYSAALVEMTADPNFLLRLGHSTWDPAGGPLIVMGAVLAEQIRETGAAGISPHLDLCSIQWGSVTLDTNQGVGFTPEEKADPWPQIARTWPEWRAASGQRLASAGLSAVA